MIKRMHEFKPSKRMKMLYEKRLLLKGPRIVVIGGGTGISVMLRGLKHYTSNITAVVTVADDGGSSGMLRKDMGMIPPGDIRNCIVALANVEPIMEKIMQHRFTEGSLKGQNFGNLFIAALTDICSGFEDAIRQISSVLAVTGRVLPVSLDNITLCAELDDGTIIRGESNIPVKQIMLNKNIKRVFMEPYRCQPLEEVIDAINDAEAIVLGPGSLYTSIIPNLLVGDISEAIRKSDAVKLYISNIMTQPGETIGYSVSKHIEAIRQHGGDGLIEYVIVNKNYDLPLELLNKYLDEGAEPVKYDEGMIKKLNIQIIERDLVKVKESLIRHNSEKLAKAIIELVIDRKMSPGKFR